MSARRKTLLFSDQLPSQDDPEVVDDGAEKRRRLSIHQDPTSSAILNRQKRVIQENQELRTTPNLNSSRPNHQNQQLSAQPKPSNEQLSCLYNNCVKLLNENKINAKNAFQLKLIDYMSDIVLNKEIVGGVTNFQVVGCTIDVGTKIYAARVDALHQNTYQMLDGIRRTGNDEENSEQNMTTAGVDAANENEDMNEGDDDQQSKKAKTKKKRVKKSSQIAENLDSITSKIRDDFQDEDLYFSKISTCIESEAIGGILMNKLHYIDDTNEILINKDDKINTVRTNIIENEDIELNMKEFYNFYRTKGIDLRNLKLCSELSNFRFIGWNLETEDEISKLVQSMNSFEENLEAHRFDANNKQSQLNLSNEIPAGGDMDIEDFNDMDADPDGIQMGASFNQNPESSKASGMEMLEKLDDFRSLNSIADLTTLISNSPSDYSYFNIDKLKLHDLPKHLKRMAAIITTQANSSEANGSAVAKQTKATTVRSKKEAPRLEFSHQTDLSKFYKITKKAIYLCDRTIEKRSEKAIRIETERQYDFNSREMFQAYGKPITAKVFTDIDQVENLLVNEEIELHKGRGNAKRENGMDDDDGHLGGMDDDFEMPCSAQTNEPFFTQNGHEFAQSQQTDGINVGNDLMHLPDSYGELQRLDGENLIQAPLQVNALNIEYAKTSKNIDVRKLKQVIWSLLCATDDKENMDESSMNENGNMSKRNQSLNINASLKEVYKQLKPPIISQKVYDDLSICIVFQMLLFLANEHNLLLKNDPIGSDVIITNY